jgi:glutamyl-tRNA reductase
MLAQFHSIAFTHRNLDVNTIGKLHIEIEEQEPRLHSLKERMAIQELMFLSTCNRVEFLLVITEEPTSAFLESMLSQLYPEQEQKIIKELVQGVELSSGHEAVEHLLKVASSIDSMVVGEREIITQVRNAFEFCRNKGLTGDLIRLIIRHTIETAKKVYTETSIATKPVSVVSLAYHRLRDLNIPLDARILIIGAGVTNNNMARFLRKHGFRNFTVFNRTVEKAERLANELHGTAYALSELLEYKGGFDVIISCTGADSHVITPEIYQSLLQGDSARKVVIDIALPQDLDPMIEINYPVTHISVNVLQKISNENLKERAKEIGHVNTILQAAMEEFEKIYRTRKVELAMREVPEKVKEIRSTAVNEIFKKDIEHMDDHSREVLEKVLCYMEKKYMSVPMIMAKDILINKN